MINKRRNKNMKQRIGLFILAILGVSGAYSQDVHFSQMGYSPLNLNPALAGANNGLQAIVNYRSQWNSVATPFSTFGLSVDTRFNEGKVGYLAMGLNFFSDQAGEARVSTTSMSLNLAYHVYLGSEHKLGAGIFGGFGQRSIRDIGTWGAQWDGGVFNPAFSSQETIDRMQFMHVDAGGGLLYTYEKDNGRKRKAFQNRVNVGAALFHVNTPNYSFIANSTDKLHMRVSAFASALFQMGSSSVAIEPAVYVNMQGPSMEMLFGTYLKYAISGGSKYGSDGDVVASIGGFYRNKDAFIAKLMFTWTGLSVGFAYDINTSQLSAMSRSRGGFELFLQWAMNDSPFSKKKKNRSRWR
jgi:type IX secretion system PorP/SprF family membrane protein